MSTFDIDAPGMLDVVKKTVCPANATDAEFLLFVEFCRSTKLNPLKHEVWFIKTEGYYSKKHNRQVEGKVQIMTGINGYLTIANSQPEYDGMDEPEFFYKDKMFNNKKELIKCIARVWRKDRSRPAVGVAFWEEYFPGPTESGKGIWETKPHVMLGKVAKSIALREAFIQILGGTYTEDEMDNVPTKTLQHTAKTIAHVAKETINNKQEEKERFLLNLIDTFAEISVSEAMLKEHMQKGLEEFTKDDIKYLMEIGKKIKSGEAKPTEWFLEGVTGEL